MNHLYMFLSYIFETRGGGGARFFGPQDGLGWSMVISDLGIFISHIGIAIGLAYFTFKRLSVQYSSIIWLFVIFIVLCGLTHLVELSINWFPWYRLSALVKIMALLIAIYTTIALLKVIPKVLESPGVAATRAHLSWIIESTLDAIISCDVHGNILSWNKGAEKLLGFTFDEVKGRPLHSFVPLGGSSKDVQGKIQSLIKGELIQNYEINCANKFGKVMSFWASASKLTNEGGDIIGFCCILTDLTEKIALEENLKEKVLELAILNSDLFLQRESLRKVNQELEYRNKELDSFTFLASHDLKSPLRAISLSADCLLEEISHKIEPAQVKLLKMLKERSLNMQRLLDDLLLYAKVGTGVGQVEEINTYKLVCDVVKLLCVPDGQTFDISPDLPWIISHRIPLQQIFQNLISNAIKHNTKPQGARVKVFAQEYADYVKFFVEDNGPGIPKAYHEKIFMMFQTLKSKDSEQGNGIGLAIVKKLMDRFDGKIEISSVIGEGTTISFCWPKYPSQRNGGSSNPLSLRECS